MGGGLAATINGLPDLGGVQRRLDVPLGCEHDCTESQPAASRRLRRLRLGCRAAGGRWARVAVGCEQRFRRPVCALVGGLMSIFFRGNKMNRTIVGVSVLGVGTLALLAMPAQAKKCPPDSVQVGTLCVDTYEASVWSIPAANTSLIKKVQKGKV